MGKEEVQRAAERMTDLVKKNLQGKKFDYEDIPRNVIECMEIAQEMCHLSGEEKQEAVTKAIQMAIDETDCAGPLEGVIIQMVPRLIDAILDVDKGKLVINKNVRNCFFSCWSLRNAR